MRRPNILDHTMPTHLRDRFILAGPAIAVALLAMITPADDGPTICPFALCTGTACPGCGMTRAASHLIRGQFGVAVDYHPLIPLLTIQVFVGWAWFLLRRMGLVRPMSQRVLTITLLGTALALITVWGFRLISGSLPPV